MDKYTSGATCAAGPALAWQDDLLWVAFSGGGGLGAAAPNYKLNVMPVQTSGPSDSWSFERLLVLDETTGEQPALTSFNGQLWLSWTGTDAAHRLNLLPLTVSGDGRLTAGAKVTLDWTATGGPALLANNGKLCMGFSNGGGLNGGPPHGQISIAYSSNGKDWPQSQFQALNQTSLLSPSLAQAPGDYGAPQVLYLAFVGTDHHIYLSDSFDSTIGTQLQVLTVDGGNTYETSDYAPSLSIDPSNDGSSGMVLWTGSGSNRHIWSMSGGGLPLNSEGSVGFGFRQDCADTSQFAPSVLITPQGALVAWAGTDNAHRLNIADYYRSMPKIP